MTSKRSSSLRLTCPRPSPSSSASVARSPARGEPHGARPLTPPPLPPRPAPARRGAVPGRRACSAHGRRVAGAGRAGHCVDGSCGVPARRVRGRWTGTAPAILSEQAGYEASHKALVRPRVPKKGRRFRAAPLAGGARRQPVRPVPSRAHVTTRRTQRQQEAGATRQEHALF